MTASRVGTRTLSLQLGSAIINISIGYSHPQPQQLMVASVWSPGSVHRVARHWPAPVASSVLTRRHQRHFPPWRTLREQSNTTLRGVRLYNVGRLFAHCTVHLPAVSCILASGMRLSSSPTEQRRIDIMAAAASQLRSNTAPSSFTTFLDRRAKRSGN